MQPLRIKFHSRPFQAARDENGVPHIQADSWSDALYGLGYLHAMDRATQILFARAVATGRSAELIADKPELQETDRLFRQVGLYLPLDDEVARLPHDKRAELEAYCQGVNDGFRQAGRSLPMWAVGFQPQPWDVPAVLLMGNLLNFGGLVISQQQQERLILELVQSGVDPPRLRELFAPLLDSADFDLLRQVKISSRLSDEALELITDLPRLSSSNAWAVGPGRSASGHALLASDPHLEVNRLPAIWYEAVLRWGDEYVLGASLPGCATFAVGRTRRLAWGVTYLKGDTSDFFVEDCRLAAQGWEYRRGNSWLPFRQREETHRRKSGTVETQRVYFNELGILDGDPAERGPGLHLLIAWTGAHEGVGSAIITWLDLIHRPDAASAMDLVRNCPLPSLCWVFADAQGHIGLQTNGLVPLRPPHANGLVPLPAWDQNNHWRGRLPVELLPRVYDPPEGFVATANEPINPPDGPPICTLPVPTYRKRRIEERLRALPKATLADMQALQYDVVSLQARDLLAVLLPHLPPGEIKDTLSSWDGSYHPRSTEATLFTRLYRRVLLEIFGQEPGGIGWRRMLYLCTRSGFSLMVVTLVDRLLLKEHSLWWRGRDKGQLIRQAAEKLAADRQAGDHDRPWSEVNAFRFTNRFFEGQFVGRALGFHTRDMPMPGCFATPFQGHLLRAAKRETTFAPSYHFVTDLGTDEAWTNLPGGPSESRFSRWYKCDLPRWARGQYKRLRGVKDEA
jgi:penicillin amidase